MAKKRNDIKKVDDVHEPSMRLAITAESMLKIAQILKRFDDDARRRVVRMVFAYYDIPCDL